MLYAVFNGHGMFVFLVTLTSAVIGVLGYRTAPASSEKPVLRGLFAAAVTAVVSLTLWTTGSPDQQARTCVVNRDLVEPFTTDQGLLNACLFMPIGLLGVLATRHVLGTLIGGVLLTVSIETLQAVLTFLGRGCDTSDLLMNTLGVVAGALCGWAVSSFDRPPAVVLRRPLVAGNRIAALGTSLALAGTWFLFITPEVVSYTVGIGRASSEQETAVEVEIRKFFGDHYEISQVQFARGPEDMGTVMAQLVGGGSVELSWPDRRKFTAYLDMSNTGDPSGYFVPGRSGSPSSIQEAAKTARSYAETSAPWGLEGSVPSSVAVGEKAELGWMTSWRRRNADGVLMPMRLDVQVDRSGRVTQLIALNIADPALPVPRITKDQAVSALVTQSGATGKGIPQKPNASAELLAEERDGKWIPTWLVEVQGTQLISGSVDAVSGRVIEAVE
ncbi:VanZ family protein [Streptomyces sp. NPDC059534]|uniref:VanZ family protein n=1 Tax=Streptomyces sp. NPDC059534 TaxID=3346859 RepID=UPI0036A35CCB